MTKAELPKWKTTDSKYLVNDRWLKLRADTCITPTGHEISPFYVLEYGDWASCVVLSDNNEVIMLRHYRHGVGDYVLEIPAGGIEDGETPEQAIRRELEEELGLTGAAIHATGVSYANPANQTNKVHSFIALGGTFDGKRLDEPGADFMVVKMPLDELVKFIESQTEIMQSLHLTAIFFALNFLKAIRGRRASLCSGRVRRGRMLCYHNLMTLDFIRFQASDGVALTGRLSNQDGDTAAIHIHGMSGNGYENYFLDDLRQMYAGQGISFFAIDTRGRGIISSFWQNGRVDEWGEGTKLGGSCYEIFDESTHDIQGAIDYLRSKGKTRFILQGHSLGGSKVVNFALNGDASGVEKLILLAPTDMTGWASSHAEHQGYLAKAKQLLAASKGEELVDAQCWLDKTPLSAQTYPTICEAGSAADIYGERPGGALLGRVKLPMLIAYGDDDIGITRMDSSMDKWLERVNKIKHANTQVAVIKGAAHGFKGYEAELARVVSEFVK